MRDKTIDMSCLAEGDIKMTTWVIIILIGVGIFWFVAKRKKNK
jgi:LPXTG-motif cell wall-anchored protein